MVTRYEGIPFVARFRWSVGEIHEEFLKGLKDAKLIASKCNCGYTVFPPRARCPKCFKKLGKENLVEISGRGVVESFTKVFFKLDGNGNEIWLENPENLALVKLVDTNSRIVFRSLEEVCEGNEVEIVWNTERSGNLSDILGVKKVRK
ncbi:MAG: Zn-ribbon domain-containing OB-fold protein [Archaeoglobaceae archaeon]